MDTDRRPAVILVGVLLVLSAGCKRSPQGESSDPSGWVRVEIDSTYSLALPKAIEQSRYGHPEGKVELFKTNGLQLHAALIYDGVDEPARSVKEPNTVINGRPARLERFRQEPDPTITTPLGVSADFGDVGDARRTLRFMFTVTILPHRTWRSRSSEQFGSYRCALNCQALQ